MQPQAGSDGGSLLAQPHDRLTEALQHRVGVGQHRARVDHVTCPVGGVEQIGRARVMPEPLHVQLRATVRHGRDDGPFGDVRVALEHRPGVLGGDAGDQRGIAQGPRFEGLRQARGRPSLAEALPGPGPRVDPRVDVVDAVGDPVAPLDQAPEQRRVEGRNRDVHEVDRAAPAATAPDNERGAF